MKVPCAECIVKVRCMLKIEIKTEQRKKIHVFKNLLRECHMLREYFELENPTSKIKLRNYFYGQYGYRDDITPVLREIPYGIQKLDAFLKVMHKPVTTQTMRVRVRKPK